jgi:hypothetical protein
MRPLFVALVWLVAAAHFAFLVYLPCGGFLALRWRRGIFPHLAAVLWGLSSVAVGLWCPLTSLEQWARSRAGMAPLSSAGFIDHYITGVIYPAGATGFIQAAVLVAVLVSWTGYALTAGRGVRHRRTVVGIV